MIYLLAAAVLGVAQADELIRPSPYDSVVVLELTESDSVLEGHGRCDRVEYTSEFSGTLHVWTKARGELDLFLRIEEPDGKFVLEDDDSGGKPTPYVQLEVEAGRKLVVLAAISKGASTGELELHFVAAPETEGTLAAADEATSAIAEIKRLREAKALDAARMLAVETLSELLAVPGGTESERISARLWDLGFETHGLSIPKTTQSSWGRALVHRRRTLPDDHPDLQWTRQNLGVTLKALDDKQGARALEEKVLEVRSRTLPEYHRDLQAARHNLAATLHSLGDLAGARTLQEQVLEVLSRTLPEEDTDLQRARLNLAVTIKALGDIAGARSLEERVLDVFSRTLPDEHPDLQKARQNLAATLHSLGDFAGAQALQEQVLDVRSRTLPEGHTDLQWARQNLAAMLYSLGEFAGARALLEKVLEVFSGRLADKDPNLQRVWQNLALTLRQLGDLQGARALEEKVLEVRSRTLPDEHADLQKARQNLAVTFRALGNLSAARALEEKVLEVRSRTLPDEHPDLQKARQGVVATILSQAARDGQTPGKPRCAELAQALCLAQVRAAREALLGSSSREAEARCSWLSESLGLLISLADGYGVFEPIAELDREAFVLSETTRGAALGSAALMRAARSSQRYADLRTSLRKASDELAAVAQKGTTNDEFRSALGERDRIERELIQLARDFSGGSSIGLEFDVGALAARFSGYDAVVGLRRYTRACLGIESRLDSTGRPAITEELVESLCAFVLRQSAAPEASADGSPSANRVNERAQLTRVELGPIAPIENAVYAWRDSLGVTSRSRGLSGPGMRFSQREFEENGARLRRLVFDPLLHALHGAEHVIMVSDDVLHLVPLDALPTEDHVKSAGVQRPLLGDRWRIETRVTIAELLAPAMKRSLRGQFVAVGDVSYGSIETSHVPRQPIALTEAGASVQRQGQPMAIASDAGTRRVNQLSRGHNEAGLLRGSAWAAGFPDLPGTGSEMRGIAWRFREQFGDQEPMVLLSGVDATRENLLEIAPHARWLHIATHGWFAPESIKSWGDLEPSDKQSGLGVRMSSEEQVRRMSPMLLCGLALAGASLPEDALGRMPGLVTAEELSTLDLTNCELVVLSACDTNVGERRAGQGVASLQKALQMAGATSVITSLWKVDDRATRFLMTDFYRRLWVDKKPKWQALWEAKQWLRRATNDELDELDKGRGSTDVVRSDKKLAPGAPPQKTGKNTPYENPCYWAGFVLTGDPN